MTLPTSLRIVPDDRHIARLALFAAKRLRNVDQIALHDLGHAMDRAADRGLIHPFADNSQLTRIMQQLGWHKIGYAGEEPNRSPLYGRQAATAVQP